VGSTIIHVLKRISLTLLLFSPLCFAGQASWLEDYAAKIQFEAAKYNVPGYVFVYVEKGGKATVISYGKTAKGGTAIAQNTVFRLASVSKTFTSMLTAKLVKQHKMTWQTPISSMAPEFGFNQASLAGLNLQHLIGQSSGYMPNAYDNLIDANYPVKRVLNKLADLQPLCSPGQCYTYQNALFGVLEYYFQGQHSSYQSELTREILNPLVMKNASVGKTALVSAPSWAKPHVAIDKRKWLDVAVENNYYKYSPAAGVNASIDDMTIWIRAMLGEYPDVVSPDLIATVTEPRVKTIREVTRKGWSQFLNDAHYGLGWRVYDFNGHKLNYHGGWVKGYRADVAFAPEQNVGYAMLMNAESNLINQFTAEFWHSYFVAAEKKQQPKVAVSD
jgi:beta-lactamase class C